MASKGELLTPGPGLSTIDIDGRPRVLLYLRPVNVRLSKVIVAVSLELVGLLFFGPRCVFGCYVFFFFFGLVDYYCIWLYEGDWVCTWMFGCFWGFCGLYAVGFLVCLPAGLCGLICLFC